MIGLRRAAVKESGTDGISIIEICPGPVDTPMEQRYIGSEAEDTDKLAEMSR
jgi:NAD(P)-dependent dehydrogenase (short-subunit alcohol dehydrogenase family)